ncbi:hypothetical protein AAFN46_07725 [Pseudomonas sp. CAU 1711]|uniref:hypothetical protein n=1 Tax=Pseudomonas sp. CAU 1711 TaxID=3140356 RepID=UPI0032606F58
MRHLFMLTLLASVTGCQNEESPSAFYERYNESTAAGITTLEEDARFYSSRKNRELDAKILSLMKATSKTKEDVVRLYLDVSKSVARCKEIHLEQETVAGDTAHLVYSQTDICGNTSTEPETQNVWLVDENGWKIDKVEISL